MQDLADNLTELRLAAKSKSETPRKEGQQPGKGSQIVRETWQKIIDSDDRYKDRYVNDGNGLLLFDPTTNMPILANPAQEKKRTGLEQASEMIGNVIEKLETWDLEFDCTIDDEAIEAKYRGSETDQTEITDQKI